MSHLYRASWWTITLAEGWRGRQDKECHTFVKGTESIGALQISAYQKGKGVLDDTEVKQFLENHIEPGQAVQPIRVRNLNGFYVSCSKNGVYWRTWCLHSENLLLFVTYNRDEGQMSPEDAEVETMLGTLKPTTEM